MLLTRTLNCIHSLKQQLLDVEESELFNDLLILSHIAPTLPNKSLLQLLQCLKPHLQRINSHTPQPLSFD